MPEYTDPSNTLALLDQLEALGFSDRHFLSFITSRSRKRSQATGSTAKHCGKKVRTFEHQRTNWCRNAWASSPASTRQVRSSPGHQPYSSVSPRQYCSRFLTIAGPLQSKSSPRSARTPLPKPCGLTSPSSGRSKGRFAPFGPPLMSNVRFQNRHRRAPPAVNFRARSRAWMRRLSVEIPRS